MSGKITSGCTEHKGHRIYIGGIIDGQVAHLVSAHPSDYPQTIGTLLRHGQRSWYEIDHDASEGSEVVYRFIGLGREFPQRPIGERTDRP
jgi:hypothetical protein